MIHFEAAGKHRVPTGKRQRTGGWGWLAGVSLLASAVGAAAEAGQRTQYSRTSPQLPYTSPTPVKYNLKFGKLTARVTGSVDVEYNDNIDLAESHGQSDLSIGARMAVGFRLPVTEQNVMQMDMEVGYRWYLNHPAINTISVAPATQSHWDQTIIIGQVRINFHDVFSVQTDPLTRQEISGKPGKLINFRRFHNGAGISADWQPVRRWVFFGGYDYIIDRGLSDDFASLNRDDHSFNGGVEYQASERLSARFTGGYTVSEFAKKIQNGGDSWSIGPGISWHVTKRIDIEASASYWVSHFDQTGTVGDKSQFSGVVFSASARQELNRRTSHSVRFNRGIGLGFGSNYTDSYALQYSVVRKLSRNISVNANLAYEPFRSSGLGGEAGERYLFNVGTSFKLSSAWHAGVGYAFALKNSSLPGRDYTQNRLTLDLTRQF